MMLHGVSSATRSNAPSGSAVCVATSVRAAVHQGASPQPHQDATRTCAVASAKPLPTGFERTKTKTDPNQSSIRLEQACT